MRTVRFAVLILGSTFLAAALALSADRPGEQPRAFIDGSGPDWKPLTAEDFVNVNCDKETWSGKDGHIHCTGKPIGVCRTKKQYSNFELVAQWRHNKSAGNSGIFVWVPEEALKDLKRGSLPGAGIEVQILDHGYAEQYEKQTKKKPDFFTTNGDVFAVGKSRETSATTRMPQTRIP